MMTMTTTMMMMILTSIVSVHIITYLHYIFVYKVE